MNLEPRSQTFTLISGPPENTLLRKKSWTQQTTVTVKRCLRCQDDFVTHPNWKQIHKKSSPCNSFLWHPQQHYTSIHCTGLLLSPILSLLYSSSSSIINFPLKPSHSAAIRGLMLPLTQSGIKVHQYAGFIS